MSSPSRIQHPLRAEKRRTFNQKKFSRQPQNALFRTFFPSPGFSTHWKHFFQSLENPRKFFPIIGKPHKNSSNRWKLPHPSLRSSPPTELPFRLFFDAPEFLHVRLVGQPRLLPAAQTVERLVAFPGHPHRIFMTHPGPCSTSNEFPASILSTASIQNGRVKSIRRFTRNSAVSRKMTVIRFSVSISSSER